MPKTVSPELLDLKAQLDSHRQSHPKRSRLPEPLWQQAVALLERHSVSAICRLTHLHPEGLLKRANSSGAKLPAPPPPQTFLQLDPATLNSPTPERPLASAHPAVAAIAQTSAYRLSVERPDGSRLTLSLPSSEWSHIEAVCSLFLRA